MAWYAYCIAEQEAFQGSVRARRPFPIEGLRGINNSQVFGYPAGEFAVVVSEYVPEGGLDQKAIVDHARIISECFRLTTVLPFRFGTVFNDEEMIRRSVRANRKHFGESVARLRGKAEMRLKILVRDSHTREAMNDITLPDSVGGEYLTKLREKASKHRERQTKARALSVQVHKLLNPLEEDVICRKAETGDMLIDIAHLIEGKAVQRYQSRYNSILKQFKDVQLNMSGPWPPYHFIAGKRERAS